MMLDRHSRKILRYIRKKGRASFDEIMNLFREKELAAYIMVKLHTNLYTICVEKKSNGKTQAVYELQDKGYAVLEDFSRHIFFSVTPIIVSICALIISVVALICT